MMYKNIIIFNSAKIDPNVLSFIDATGVRDSNVIAAVKYGVDFLKTNGLWVKNKVIIPCVGNDATSCKVNMKSPGTFDFIFYGGFTFSRSIIPNDNDAYAECGIIGGTHITSTNYGVGINITNSYTDGAAVFGTGGGFHLQPKFQVIPDTYMRGIGASPDSFFSVSTQNLYAMYGKSINSAGFRNKVKELAGTSGYVDAAPLRFFGNIIGGYGGYISNFIYVCDALTDAEHNLMADMISNFNLLIGR